MVGTWRKLSQIGSCSAALRSDIEQRSRRIGSQSTVMEAAWYEEQGAARDVLNIGEMPDP
jgi:hypothetical protein